jgi:hypothetical protein
VTADPKAALRNRARVVGWGVALVVAVQGAAAYLAQNHTGAVIAQVVIAEFGTSRLGVAWSDPLAPLQTGTEIAKRALRGAGFGAAAAAVLVGASILARAATVSTGTFGVAPLLVGLVLSICAAARDELMLRGLVLRALGPNAKMPVQLLVCGVAGAAFRFGTQTEPMNGATIDALVFAFASSIAFACLWLRDRGAWLAAGANAAFMFVTGPIAQGAVLDVRSKATLDGTIVAVVCGFFFAGSAISYARRNPSSIEAA